MTNTQQQDQPTVQQAMITVMKAVGAVRKDGRNKHQGFNFRGIDAVVNAVSPALQKAGVVVTPELQNYERRTMQTNKGNAMNSVDVIVRYTFTGPAGDTISATVPGEAFDSGDKATAKAMSVAFRTALLQALALPTDEPDPDEEVHYAVPQGHGVAHSGRQVQQQQGYAQQPQQYAQQQYAQHAQQMQAQQQTPQQQQFVQQQAAQAQQQQQAAQQQGTNWAAEYERAKDDPQQLASLRKWAAKVGAPDEVLVHIRTREQQLAQYAQQQQQQ